MTYVSDHPLTVDGVRLDTLAWGIEASELKLGGLRAADDVLAGLDGEAASLNDAREPSTLTLSMFVRGTDEDGTVPADQDAASQLRENLDHLLHLFAQSGRLIEVRETVGASRVGATVDADLDAEERVFYAKVADSIAPTTEVGSVARFTVALRNPGCYWRDPAPVDWTRGNGAGLVVQRTNQAPNPAFRATSPGPYAYRRNLATNPNLVLGRPMTGGGPVGSVTTAPDGSLRLTHSATGGANYWDLGRADVTSGRTYTVSFEVLPGAGVGPLVGVGATAFDAALADAGNASRSMAAAAGVWTRVSVQITAGAAVIGLRPFVYTTEANSILNVRNMLVEESPAAGPYFDGSTAANAGLAYAWDGTPGASASSQLTSGSVLRVNLCPNPSFEVDTYYWTNRWFGGSGGTGSLARVAGAGLNGGAALKKTWTTANNGSAQDTGVTLQLPAVIQPGQTYALSCYFRSSVATNAQIDLEWRDASNAVVRSVGGTPILAPAGAWVRPSAVAVAPAGAVTLYANVGPYGAVNGQLPPSMAVGDYYLWDQMLVEPVATVGTYFDGSTPAVGGVSYAWNGTAGQSPSIALGAVVADVGAARVAQWRDADGWLTLRPDGGGSDSFAYVSGDTGGMRLGMRPGRTYTISADLDLPQTMTDPQWLGNGQRGTISVFTRRNGVGDYTLAASPVPASTAGTSRVSVTVAVPADAVEALVRLYHGGQDAARGELVRWRNLLVEEAATAGPYFDGATPAPAGLAHGWTGAVDASTSQEYRPADPFATGLTLDVDTLTGASAPVDDAVLLLTGPTTGPAKITDTATGSFVRLNEPIPAGSAWRVNVDTWETRVGPGLTLDSPDTAGTAKDAVTDQGGGYPRWLRLNPRRIGGARRVQVKVDAPGMTAATALSIRARRAYL